jgi:predicted DNA-binding transcriptional regulator AlpA
LRILSLKETADRSNLSLRQLQRIIALGEGPATIQLSKRRVGIDEADHEAWLISRKKPVAPKAAQPEAA